MSGFSAVDLPSLPFPGVIDELNFETLYAKRKADLLKRDPSLANTLALESEPITVLLQENAYRELKLRQRINEAAKAVMLAYALKSDLDHRGASFNVERLLITEGDPDAVPPVEPVYEDDEAFRRRIQLAFEGFSTAGPEGAYIFHALGADGDVKDASIDAPRFSYAALSSELQAQLPSGVIVLKVDYDAGLLKPMPGDVVVSVLSRTGDGAASDELVSKVDSVLSSDDVRPLVDAVNVQSSQIINYAVDATLYFYSGPDRAVVLKAAREALDKYVEAQHRNGLDITLSGIYAALHQPGVQRVELHSPSASIQVNKRSAAYCAAITITDGGIDE